MTGERRAAPSSDEVIAALRAAGWLLEQDTAATFERAGFHVAPGKAFPDPDEPTVSREIDVYGFRQLFRSDELTFTVNVRLLAECKQSSMPYVAVGAPASARELARERKEQHFRFRYVETGRTALPDGKSRLHSVTAREYLGLDDVPGNPWEQCFVGTQMTRLDRKATWLADNRGIFTSLIYPLAKALTYFRKHNNRSSYSNHRPGAEWASTDFYYPLVVTSAPLFVVDTTAGELEAVEVPWTTVTREIKSTSIDGQFNVDVVTASSLEDYLSQRVNKFGDAVAGLARSDPQRFITNKDYSFGVAIH